MSIQVKARPDAPAVHAHDEQWTFQEVDELSSVLARHLVMLGAKKGMKIPLVFEKSGWFIIALIAVSKASAAFVPVDPSQPVFRLKEIMEDVKPKFLLSSSHYSALLAESAETTVVVSRESVVKIQTQDDTAIVLPYVSPRDEAYVMYTSGSTGKPKGAVIHHGGYLSALLLWTPNLGPGSRMLQNSSYACEFSKQNGLTQVFEDMHITYAILSPSISKTIRRDEVKHLETVVLCGEPVSPESVAKWASEKTTVWVHWAATECLSLARPDPFTAESDVRNLGRCSAVCRVVEVGNPDKQVPIGSVGEIVVHAPWIASCYLNNADRTAATFLDRPDWLDGKPSSYGSRWYRVGDLVRQNSDGSLVLAGRGDNMVKVRGQRFDMSEVERALGIDPRVHNSLPIIAREGLCKHRLAAVIALQDFSSTDPCSEELILLEGAELQEAAAWTTGFREELAQRIPSFMIPTIWVLVKQFPLTITGKIDRVLMKRFVEKMDVETFEHVCSLGITPEPPVTEMEERLQGVWSEVLKLPRKKIGRNQSFISLGGDSILGMIVAARCNDINLQLRVQDILKYGTIAELATRTTTKPTTKARDAVHASKYDDLRKSIIGKLQQVGVWNIAEVEDAYPTSPMQQGMLLSKARLSGDYNTSTIYEVLPKRDSHVPNPQLLTTAWQKLVNRYSILRTFFVESVSQSGSYDQVVLRNWDAKPSTTIWQDVDAVSNEDVIQFFNSHLPPPYVTHQPPHNFTVVLTQSRRLFCRLNAEHTLVDGMSLAVIARDIVLAYDGVLQPDEKYPYSAYIAPLQQVACSIDNKYWKSYLQGMNPCLLPNLSYSLSRDPTQPGSRHVAVEITSSQQLLKFCQSQELTISALFRAVWGLILRAYTGLDEVAFGYITSGRDIPIPGVAEMVGTLINMLVCRMDLTTTSFVKDVISKAQTDYENSLPHQHASLAQIQHVLGLYGQQLFNTSMTVLKDVPLQYGESPSIALANIHEWSPNEYDLDVQCWVSKTDVKMELRYRAEKISTEHARNIASTFSKALDAITDDPEQRIGQLDLFSDHHRRQIWEWNSRYPDTIDTCLHDMVSARVAERPDEIVVDSWERKMTWRQLEEDSDRLAHHLISLGVGPEVHVLLCFEKSALAIVAMVSVLNKLFEDEGLRGRVPRVLSVDQSFVDSSLLSSSGKPQSTVGPSNAAFVLFTSGSTGVPKGMVHTHTTIASSLHAHGDVLEIGPGARTLQFSAFVFDISITEIFTTLTRGGVLCIPSEHERMNDLASAFTRMSVNWAHLTPTVASLLDPTKVPTLKHMTLAGEPLKKINVTEWAPRIELINLYGPAECALATTLRRGLVKDDRVDNIGRAYGLLVWLVDAQNPDKLVPVGAVGEILCEGPNVAREYLKDKERTLASFIENPAWLQSEKTIPPRRFYRTGDLARYNGDGSIQILGRIDTQVKLHGQRVELGEIEYQVKVKLSPHKLVNMAVAYAKSAAHPGGGLLAAFLELEEKAEGDEDQLMLSISRNLRRVLVGLDTYLAENLPSYMVPSIYVPLNAMPLLTAGKIDRGKLTRILKSLSPDQMALYSLSEFQAEKVMPRTRMERMLQKLWAKLLNIEERSIGVDDNFFQLGADSVVAMKLASAGRENGVIVTVANIFQNPRLSDLAAIAKPHSERVLQELETRYKIQRRAVQEMYPATPLQEGLLILSNRQPGTYVVQHVLSLNSDVDVSRLRTAWESVHSRNAILRTRIVHVERTIGSMQVVLDEAIQWKAGVSLDDYLEDDRKQKMDYGEVLSRYAIIEGATHGPRYFVWTAHHSIFDSWSASSLFSEVASAYQSLDVGSWETSPSDTTFKAFSEQIFNMDVSAAEAFWRDQFSDLPFSPFPKLPAGHRPLAKKSLDYSIKFSETIADAPVLLRAAWALLLSQYSDTHDNVVFGMTIDGRGELGANQILGPTFASVPVKVSINAQSTIDHFLSRLRDQERSMEPWQNFGLQNIKDLSADAAKACDFQTLLAIHPQSRTSGAGVLFNSVTTRDAPSTYLLILECQLTENGVDLKAQYDPEVISASQIQRLLYQMDYIVGQLITGGNSAKQIKDIKYCSPQDVKDISSWNHDVPAPLQICIHDVISSHAGLSPNAPAVVSRDEDLTYRELDSLSTNLAHYLVAHFGIGPESLVPLCFTKSVWTVVAQLAVLKAGGAYVPMDPTHPVSRLQEILDATKAQVILCSPEYEALSQSMSERACVVSRKTVEMCKEREGPACRTVSSDNSCYIIFTSGSTGKPKGVQMTHSGFATAATAQGKRINLNSGSRVIHFSSYAFEACILEILTTLFNGGCVCVAPEPERLEEIAKTMRELRVNWAFFTPSFIRTIHPDQVPDLETLVLGGEALGADNIDVWVDRVYLVNGYGPSETCVFSVINEHIRRGHTTPDMIGGAIGGACWIVDPDDHTKLVPLGAVGELLIEGPTLACGYLDDPVRTNEVFVDNAALVQQLSSINGASTNGSRLNGNPHGANGANRHGSEDNGISGKPASAKANGHVQKSHRMYKTGDLVRYDTSGTVDGTIRFVGRKDQQVKVRGQRMELGDIEHHLKINFETIRHVAVEQVTIRGRDSRYLAAFFSLYGQSSKPQQSPTTLSMSAGLKKSIMKAEAALVETLPSYMVPNLYVPLSAMPLLSSGKTNRRELHHMSLQLSESAIQQYSLADDQKRLPITDTEVKLASLWARLLRLGDQAVLGLDDGFFRLGGDSIGAMHLTTLARDHGILLTVAKIFQYPRLEDMAAAALTSRDVVEQKLEPFALLQKVGDTDTTLRKLYERYQLPPGTIEDAFPTSALQEGLFVLSIKQPGSYMSQITLTLQPAVDIDHFKHVWQKTADRNSILRTRIAHTGTQSIQFIVRERICWRSGSDLKTYLVQDKTTPMDHGGPLVRYAIIVDSEDERHFVLTAHHSLYDGWSLMLIMEDFNHLYNKNGRHLKKEAAAPPPYASFIKHLMTSDVEASKSFWQSRFSGRSLSSFPEPRTVTQAPVETQISQFAEIKRPAGSDITLSTVIRAAWGLVTARYADTEDVFFGAISTGRNASLSYIERMTGPTITTVPICISIDGAEAVVQYLQRVQDQATDMIPFEHTGLQVIKTFGPEAEKVCGFQNLLVIQPEGSEDMSSEIWKESVLFAKGEMVTMTYALIVECRLYKHKIRITAQYREHITPTRQMQRMLDQFEQVLHQLNDAAPDGQKISDIEIVSKKDKMELLEWSKGTEYPAVDECIHHIIERQALRQPTSLAIEAWDGSFTYEELDTMSTNLAQHLKFLGIGRDIFVPLCFEKSAWTIVAILGVLKAGGGYLALDPKHPKNRKDHIIRDVSAKVILTGSQYRDDFDSAEFIVLAVDQTFMESLPPVPDSACSPGKSTDAAFVVFTSGSTGVPKGIVMDHGPFVSSAIEHSKALHINAESRVMQFAAYTYDVSMGEILTTLMQGGCVCVPTEEDRMGNLAAAINALRVNWIFLTPTVAAFLKPNDVPGLKVLVLGGEHATVDNINTWAEHVNLINSYGPAECAIWCCRAPNVSLGADPASLGYPVGAHLWITDATDPDKLTPIGCTGELLVEGPTLAREYLNDAAKTRAAFIEDPKWSVDGSGRHRRFYRTGDLVRYSTTGDILFVGRRDTQAKLHGQRIELGEIEQGLTKCCPSEWFPVVDILRFPEGRRDVTLAAFFYVRGTSTTNCSPGNITLAMSGSLSDAFDKIRSDLEQILPGHMIPNAFIPVSQLPLTAGGKVDRKALRAVGESLTDQQLLSYLSSGQTVVRIPSTEMERKLQMLWSKVLNITPGSIGADSNFLRLGGDSVAAMRLSAAAREIELLLTIKSVFTSPRLEDMAKTAQEVSNPNGATSYAPFSTLSVSDVPNFLDTIVRPQLAKDLGEIEDVLEATDYQKWTQGCGQLQTRGYNNYFILHFKGPLDLDRLQAACQKLLQHHPVLRTVFLTHKERLLQVVLRHLVPDLERHQYEDTQGVPQSLLEQDLKLPVEFGAPITRLLLTEQGQDGYRLFIRISHSLYDGISLPIIVRDLKAAYLGESFSRSSPFHRFVSGTLQVMRASDAESFWRSMLEGSSMTRLVDHKRPTYSNAISKSIKRTVSAPDTRTTGITFASIVKAAWSLVLAQLSASSDVTFGQITTGRSAPIQGIDEIVGPCMNLVPVRVKLDPAATPSSLLQQVQSQHLDMLPFESLGMHHIVGKCTSWPKWTRFSSIVQHTNFNVGMDDAFEPWGADVVMRLGSYTPDHDVSDCWIWTNPTAGNGANNNSKNNFFDVDFTYSKNTIPDALAQDMLDLLCGNIATLADPDHHHHSETSPWPLLHLETRVQPPLLPLPLPLRLRLPLSPTTNPIPTPDSNSPLPLIITTSPPHLSLVQRAWSTVFSSCNLTDVNTAFYELRSDHLLAAAQLAKALREQLSESAGIRPMLSPLLLMLLSPEEMIENPTIGMQAALISRLDN
ncbi:uncharacterized protein L3040_002832 [Drepanopeziza brunnea f. sp. 'multigermtubi']|uniref:uncharacterized protein n=1 Tax=Drepanopeziza brunnea f. sp. 'multigermtubi' TaxID=698441 RepID=UPI002399571D|nr:hypothetical protein L3040_002832 [Drepanopeziza brunnea f. sp. 'multigermtubi']